MNNTKKMILSLVSIVFVNANAVNMADYFNAKGVDKDGNTLFHKAAQSCHESDRFSLKIRPMNEINKKLPAERDVVFQTMAYIAVDPLNEPRAIDAINQSSVILSVLLMQNPNAEILQKLFDLQGQPLNLQNNVGEKVLDILRQQHDAYPEANWCTFFKNALEIKEAVDKANAEIVAANDKVEEVINTMPPQQ